MGRKLSNLLLLKILIKISIYIFLEKFGCQNMKLFVEKMHLPGYIYVHYSINTGRGCVILITSVVCSSVHGQEFSLKFG